jgi:RNA recognition motif-containing protein
MSFAGDSQQQTANPASMQQDNNQSAPSNANVTQSEVNGQVQSNGGVNMNGVNSMNAQPNGPMSDQPQESKEAKDARTIFLRNISFQATVDHLKQVPQFSNSTHINIPVDKETGRSKGYGFIEFSNAQQCSEAIQACAMGVDLLGRQLVIQQSDRAQHAKNNHNQGGNNFQPRNNYHQNNGGFRGGHNNNGGGFRGGRGGFRGGRGGYNNGGYQGGRGGGHRGYNNYNNNNYNGNQGNYGNFNQPPPQNNYGGNFNGNNNFQAQPAPPQQNYGGQFNAHAPAQQNYGGHPQHGNFAQPPNNVGQPQISGYGGPPQQSGFGGQFQ